MRKPNTIISVFLSAILIAVHSGIHVANAQTRCSRYTLGPKPTKVAIKLYQPYDGPFRTGTRCTNLSWGKGKKLSFLPNQPPMVQIGAFLSDLIVMPSDSGLTLTGPSRGIKVNAFAWDPDGDTILYTFSTTGGRIAGDGAEVSWNLDGVEPGTYTITVEADDGCGCIGFSSGSVALPGRR